MNRSERRKQAKLSRKNNNVVSLFEKKPTVEYLGLEETSEAIGFDYNNGHLTRISYQLDMYADEAIDYCKDTDCFIVKDVNLAHIVKTFENIKEPRHGFALIELMKHGNDEISQHECNVLACIAFYLTVRFDSNLVLNAVWEDDTIDKSEVNTILKFHDTVQTMSEQEVTDIFDSIPWMDRVDSAL
tara:strand:+ start:39 stop:596 length:558 start_codon:yes stop_codon:yes gene_type:complete